jgi:hypothetical protein
MIRGPRPTVRRGVTIAALLFVLAGALTACVQPPPPAAGDGVWDQSDWDAATWQ